jgi:hypothetical protein
MTLLEKRFCFRILAKVALPLSGLSLSIIVFVTAYTSYNVFKITQPVTAKLIGI